MPRKAKHPCGFPGCPNLTENRFCDNHVLSDDPSADSYYSSKRPSAYSRGYGTKWQVRSKAFLKSHPLCVRCKERGRYTQATVVDHIIPHRGDKTLFWDVDNWQPLCKPCHDRKTWTEDSSVVYEYKRNG